MLKEDAIVYRLVGPILVKQDLGEPNANVQMRIGHLAAELYVSLSQFFSVCGGFTLC